MPTNSFAPPSAPVESGRIQRLLAARRNYREEVSATIAAHRFVVFYGCGAIYGGIVERWREFVDRKIDFCCDSDPAKWGHSFMGAPCIAPEELEKIKEEAVVFVTVGNFEPVLNALIAKGFPCVRLIYKYDLISSDFLSRQHLGEVAENLERVRTMLADQRSVQVFDAVLNRLLDGEAPPGVMARVCDGDQYFPPDLLTLTADESFVDAGAFTGDTVTDFVNRTAGRFEAVHCFELDAANFRGLQTTVAPLAGAERIFLHAEGLWDQPCEISYSTEESRSTIGEGDAHGHVVRLDDALAGARVTLLKMDIEGAEPQALAGARATILIHRPRLAVCVYHHIKDLWEIPIFIKSLVPEYRIYLRHHTTLDYETVCYAVPPEA